MKFEKAQLLAIIDQAILKHRQAFDAKVAREQADSDKRKTDFVAKTNPKWAESAKKILAAVKAHKPVTKSMLAYTSGGYYPAYFEEGEYKAPKYQIPVDLLTSRKMVELSAENIVNTSQIKIRDIEAAIRASLR